MRVFKHLRSDWFRYGFETLAVVVGILVAFALENWRDTQKVKKEEHEILVNLLNDLHDAKQQSASSIEVELKSKEYSIVALNQYPDRDSLHLEFYTDSIFYELVWNVEMEIPVINSYSDIKNTGQTGLITNEQIRRSFTNLELSINNLGDQVDDRLKVHQLRMDGMAVNDLNFVRMISNRFPEIDTDNEPENNYPQLLANQRIRNLIAVKLSLTSGVLRYRRELDAEIDSLIDLLEAEINTPSTNDQTF
jgi:hypothetical protein